DWKPVHSVKTGTFIFTIKDNHGGAASPVSLSFTAQDRNTKPCLTTPNNTNIATTVNYLTAGASFNITSADKDGGGLWIEAFGFTANSSFDLIKNLRDCSTSTPIVLKQNIAQTEPTFRKNSGTMCISPRYSTDWWDGAGYVIFQRSSSLTGRPTANTTIKKGTVLTSTTAGYVQQFQTYMDVTVLPQDYILYVPVIALNTNAPAGKLTVTSLAGYTVTNASAIDNRGSVTFTRAVATTVGSIPAGTIVKTAESSVAPFVPSIQFEVPADVSLPIGTFSVTIPVWRIITELPASTALTITSWGSGASADQTGFPFTAKTVTKLTNYNESALFAEPTFPDTGRKFTVRALDGDKPAANAINAFVDPLPAGAGTITMTHSAFDLEGRINFARKNATTALTLPAGTKLTTSIRTQYETLDDIVFPATAATVTTTISDKWVRRINYIGAPTSRDFTVTTSHLNTPAKLVSDPLIQAYEGSDLTNGTVEVSDSASEIPNPYYTSSEYWYPIDRRDTFSYEIATSGAAPAGTWEFCRQTGAVGSTCSKCLPTSTSNYLTQNPSSGRTYFNTNRCYLRYRPVAADLSGTFSFKLTVHENYNRTNANVPTAYSAKSTWTTNLTLVVNEVNHAPVLTNSSFAAYGAGQGSVYTNPIVLGDYSEGTSGFYNIYTTDSNKGADLKTVNFELDSQVYDLKSNTWRARPAGLSVTVDKVEDLTASAGSKTTARITWNPTDQESKQFSGSAGLIVKMKIYDAKTSPDLTQTIYGYYKVRLINKNQIPSITTMATDNKVKVFADTYVKKEFYLYDNDAYVPQGGSFSTLLTACRDSNGNALQHATLDSGSTDPYICHATAATFAAEVTTYDPTYDRNKAVSPCFVGGVLNEDLAVPKFSPVGSPEVVSGVLRQKYQMEWCPQRGHIGVFTGELDVNDNGDVDRDGVALARAVSSTPVQLTVVAPVFLLSPRVNISNIPTHYMPQTAAGLANNPFRYEVIANNSQKNTLQYSLLNSPGTCGQSYGMCIDPLTGVIQWIPNFSTDITPNGGVGTLVRVQVLDTVTGETDAAHFYLNVQSSLSPFEQPPVINSVIPSGTSVLVSEKTPMTFSVSASDPNANDILFYRWYVNDELRSDEGASFTFKPLDTDGSVDPDGSGPKKAGEFTIRVEVTDGNYMVSRSWDVKIRNTYLLGDSIFDLISARSESLPPITPTGLSWVGEIPYGLAIGNGYQDHLIIVGNYMSGVFTKHFLWDLLTVNGTPPKPNGTLAMPPWNFTEDLPWLTGTSTHRVAINPVGTTYDMLMTSQAARSGPFGLTTEALHILNTDLTSLTLSGNNKCSGDCPTQLYTSSYYTDTRITASMDSAYVFYASDAGNVLNYDYLTPSNPTTVYSFGTAKITGMTLNRAIDRLYVTTQQISPSISHKIYVFNVAPARSGAVPTLVTSLNVFDGVVGHEDCKPSDIVFDSTTNRVFALLSGTGGVVTFPDSSSTTPTTASMEFIGVNELNSSPFDVPGTGRRLVIRAEDRLLIGTMEGANQVFTVDLTDNHVYVSATQDPITSIASYQSGQILLISRSKGKVYKAK
ncbi:MAG: hypothetical protein J7501_12075, partial [Bdellovibrio sp.]|nr:hypothetical protein [Bdellovibrio sp.]